MNFTFKPVELKDEPLVHKWLSQSYIQEWLHGVGLANTLKGLHTFVTQGAEDFAYWLAYDKDTPFAFLMTSIVHNDPKDAYFHLAAKNGQTITLDVVIGNTDFLGKGLCPTMIKEFLLSQFPDAARVLIDPEKTNTRAVHVYEKVGFQIVGEFIAPWHPVPHYNMMLEMKDLRPS
ncbi:MAG: GNAT family N-acetyltransferase [Candidatus Melainabacteria bacterium]|nr:GNAT family N-acetyltransferase [Candidatus Melainabacteria bacterium]